MDITEMRALVRKDLKDEDAASYRWTDAELDRHIAHALKDFSRAVPGERKSERLTTAGSRLLDISDLTDRVLIEAVEYPVDRFPQSYVRFAVWGDTLTLLGGDTPDGSTAYIYYGAMHTLDASGSSLPPVYEDLVAGGAAGYAAVQWASYAINRVNVGGIQTAPELLGWGREKLAAFRSELTAAGRKNRVRVRALYRPFRGASSKTTGPGF